MEGRAPRAYLRVRPLSPSSMKVEKQPGECLVLPTSNGTRELRAEIRLRSSLGANKSKTYLAHFALTFAVLCSVVPSRIIFEPLSARRILICVIMNSFPFSSLLVQRFLPRAALFAGFRCYRARWHILISPRPPRHPPPVVFARRSNNRARYRGRSGVVRAARRQNFVECFKFRRR